MNCSQDTWTFAPANELHECMMSSFIENSENSEIFDEQTRIYRQPVGIAVSRKGKLHEGQRN